MRTVKLSWSVPRWAYVPGLWREYRRVFNPRALTRITIASITCCAGIVAALKTVVPQIVLPNLWPMLFALPSILLLLAINMLFRPQVILRRYKIMVAHGQQATVIDAASVTAARLAIHSQDRIRLRIWYTKKSKPRVRTIGVPRSVNLDQLVDLLPVPPKILDARAKSLPGAAVTHNRETETAFG